MNIRMVVATEPLMQYIYVLPINFTKLVFFYGMTNS